MLTSEKKYNIEAGVSTTVVVLILLLLLWFLKLYVPDPPINERGGKSGNGDGGIELAYAPVESDHASSTPSSSLEATESEVLPTENTEEASQEPTENTENTENVINSPNGDVEVHSDPKPKPHTTVSNKPTNTTSTSSTIKPKPEVNKGDLFDGDDDGGGSPDGNSNSGSGSTGGNSPGLGVGFSNSGFGENGWLAPDPKRNKTSPKNGQITFKIEIDENGKVLSVKPKSYTVDYEIMQAYLDDCYKLKFLRKNDSGDAPSKTIGYYTFTFKAK